MVTKLSKQYIPSGKSLTADNIYIYIYIYIYDWFMCKASDSNWWIFTSFDRTNEMRGVLPLRRGDSPSDSE
jgi:hypothetical protein